MNRMDAEDLVIDPDLERLIPHLSDDEKEMLEASILEEGCREPLYVWNRTILDGHNRYRICKRHGIPFQTREAPVSSEDEAIVWICINQMGRRNISDETRHYLIGKRYEAEKRIGSMNPSGRNQYSAKEVAPSMEEQPKPAHKARYTATKVGKEYGLGHNAVEKYGKYARNIDVIGQASPELSNRLLSGELYISMENVGEIAQMSRRQIQAVSENIVPDQHGHAQHEDIMKCLGRMEARQVRYSRTTAPREASAAVSSQSVKDIPEYNPDSAISSLTLTMPTWISSMNRTLEAADMALVTDKARKALRQELLQLRQVIDTILKFIK